MMTRIVGWLVRHHCCVCRKFTRHHGYHMECLATICEPAP